MDHKQNDSRLEEQTLPISQHPSRQVIYGLVGAVLYGLFSWITNLFPLPAVGNVIFHPAVAFLVFFGVAYGPWAGLLAGFIGNTLGDILSSGGFFWNWSLGNALTGMVPGLTMIKFRDFGTGPGILKAMGWSALGIALGMMFASLVEIFLSGIDLRTAFVDYFTPAFLGNFACVIVLLPIFMMAFAAGVSGWAR
jgi:energy-coupling factor transport system substrate-specific component